MIRIAAVDDEMHVLERFERMVVKIKELELCGLFESGEELLAYLKEYPLDAVFLDIEMPDVNGLQLCEQVLDLNGNIDIIFVTAFNQYAVEAFELQAIDYIMKPFTEERLHKTVRRLLKTKRTALEPRKPFIQCFGDFEVFLDGEAIQWKNSKAKEILAFLVHKEGIAVNWEKVSYAVWPEYDAQKSQTNFHANTYLLRRRLAEAGISQILENIRGNYRVVTDEFDCDFYQFKKIVKGNHIKGKEDYHLIEKLNQTGYMESNGYSWSYSRAVQLDETCKKSMDNFKKSK
ncbi:response regulator [Clostridium tagluense]|uniref:response regulator n=1 Tax=Clostridium tagluense TaxID=360422 RepID=UPI001CF45802|nr:response regulator [Clostridium tagluense]MCB2299138.1 response regulator [Clostridium tagluense]